MNRSTSRTQLALVGAVIFTASVLGYTASWAAPTASWDQGRVSEIAKKLATAVDDLYNEQYKAPGASVPSLGSGGAHSEFMDTLRRLQHETRHLASSLEKGASAKSTRGSVKHIKELNDDLAEYGRRIEFVNPVLNQFAAFEDLLRQLAPYYGLDMKR